MPIDLFLAIKFLREGRLQTLLLIAGATIGITVVFFITALITAVERTMISQTLDVLPHVSVRRPDEQARVVSAANTDVLTAAEIHHPAQRVRSIESWAVVVRALGAMPGVTGVSPEAVGPALASRGRGTRAVTLLGVEIGLFAEVIALAPRMRRGTMDVESDRALIGIDLADDLGVDVGDRIRLSSVADGTHSFVVGGVFDMGNADVNSRWVIVSLRNGQTLLDMAGGASTIGVRLDDIWAADAFAARAESRLGLTAESWMGTNAQLMVAIQSQRGATVMIRVFIMLAVAMGIASVLVVSVLQKSRQIGILRAMGMPRHRILRIFLIQGAVMGSAGATLGCWLGTLLALWSEVSNRTADGMPMYPIELPPSLYVTSAAIAIVTGIVAAALPATRAAGLEPASAIRHD